MQIGVSNYTQNQTLGNNLQAVPQNTSAEKVAANEPAGEWTEDAVFWSDRLHELHALAEEVEVQDVGFAELSKLRQALFERGWISPSQATAMTEISQRLSDRIRYQADAVVAQAIDERGGAVEKLLRPVLAMIENVRAVQERVATPN
ncbi:MAG: hypothetical protein WEB07_01950 [Natronospirillum sp.]